MKVRLRLDNIQGNITPGFRKDHQAFIFARFHDGPSARAWLAEVYPDVATAEEVALYNLLFKAIRARKAEPHVDVVQATWVNVAFSSRGLALLTGSDESLDGFSEAFRQGLAARARLLGDDPKAMATWKVGGSLETEPHVFLLIGCDDEDDLDREIERQRQRLEAYADGQATILDDGHTLGERREPFGFRDGLSQPDDYDLFGWWQPGYDAIAPGEFILGYPKEGDDRSPDGPEWARDGSYVVFRRLAQHVGRFRAMRQLQESASVDLEPPQLGARVIGRWPSGARLGDEATDPGAGRSAEELEPLTRITAQTFADDADGQRCPRFAHVRKAYPRDLDAVEPRKHRIIRRGVPYGDVLDEDERDDDGDQRGLLFLSYQASIERQFEHIQRHWLNSPSFPPAEGLRAPGTDPLVGQPDPSDPSARSVWLRTKEGEDVPVTLEQFVTVAGGAYFFAPSIDALYDLADPELRPKRRDRSMDNRTSPYSDLGTFIYEENPYSSQTEQLTRELLEERAMRDGLTRDNTAEDPTGITVRQMNKALNEECLFWDFAGEPHRVTKAIRIPYTYLRASDGVRVSTAILIGFEGPGGQ
jgi:Dyp-type peroxidase family